ncbi:hypothetical protein [Solimonas flava]|uniref:hypothetical protein n=1 Tax=Solimonas flava TaxID=415849 RepID=UPI00041745A2|nr:hypothetical protein [Solimonas flava]
MDTPNAVTTPRRGSHYGLEFALLFLLPAAVLIAGAVTMTLAFEGGFTPLPETHGPIVNPR